MHPELPLILATDLDGTLLHGSAAERRTGYRFIHRHRAHIGLLYVTGRELKRVQDLAEDLDVPWSDHIICDVGTLAVNGQTLATFPELLGWVEERWRGANERVRALLVGETGIRLQPVAPAYRVSYYYEPGKLSPATVDRICRAGFDCLLSDERYLDVLPRGVNKGTMLLRLIDLLGLPRERVVVCGDTMNDLSLFETGLAGVVVGNAEQKLRDIVVGLETVYCSCTPGVAGIIEGVRHWRGAGVLPNHPMYRVIAGEDSA